VCMLGGVALLKSSLNIFQIRAQRSFAHTSLSCALDGKKCWISPGEL